MASAPFKELPSIVWRAVATMIVIVVTIAAVIVEGIMVIVEETMVIVEGIMVNVEGGVVVIEMIDDGMIVGGEADVKAAAEEDVVVVEIAMEAAAILVVEIGMEAAATRILDIGVLEMMTMTVECPDEEGVATMTTTMDTVVPRRGNDMTIITMMDMTTTMTTVLIMDVGVEEVVDGVVDAAGEDAVDEEEASKVDAVERTARQHHPVEEKRELKAASKMVEIHPNTLLQWFKPPLVDLVAATDSEAVASSVVEEAVGVEVVAEAEPTLSI